MDNFSVKQSFLDGSVFQRKDNSVPDFQGETSYLDGLLEKSKLSKDEIYVKTGVFRIWNIPFFIKRYMPRNWFYKLGYIFRKTRAEHSWEASIHLDRFSIPNPKVYFLCAKRKFRIIGKSYIITEAVPDAFTLDFFRRVFPFPDRSSAFYEAAVKTLAQVHNAGVFHKDAKLWNFYLIKDEGAGFEVGIWDLDGAEICVKLSPAQRIYDVSRFIASLIELNRKVDIDIYNSCFIDKIIMLYGKYASGKPDIEKIRRGTIKILSKKKINKLT